MAEIADDIGDPTLTAMITSIIGDEKRFFALLMTQVTIILKELKIVRGTPLEAKQNIRKGVFLCLTINRKNLN